MNNDNTKPRPLRGAGGILPTASSLPATKQEVKPCPLCQVFDGSECVLDLEALRVQLLRERQALLVASSKHWDSYQALRSRAAILTDAIIGIGRHQERLKAQLSGEGFK